MAHCPRCLKVLRENDDKVWHESAFALARQWHVSCLETDLRESADWWNSIADRLRRPAFEMVLMAVVVVTVLAFFRLTQ